MFEELRGYKSIYLDYSVLFEYAGTPVFDDLLKLLATGIEVYVSKSFKALHYCTLKIKDQKDRNVALAMKKICSALLAEHKMHLIKELETYKVAANITGISDGCCILTTRHSIFTKRLYEKTPDFGCDIAIITQNSLQIFDSVDSMIFNFPPQEPSKLAYNNSYIESFGNASISDIVVTENFEKYELVKRLSGGAEGMVFTTDRDGILAKIYHKGIINPLRWAKLKKLTELGITGTGFCIPQELLYAQLVRDMLKWYRIDPKDWKLAWRCAKAKWRDNPEYQKFSSGDIDVKINGAMVLLGFLWGEGDPENTIRISARGGYDSDCNPSSAAGVLFTSLGLKNIPAKYYTALDRSKKFSFTAYDFPSLIEVCERLARQVVLKEGGKIKKDSNGKELFIIPQNAPAPDGYDIAWAPVRPEGCRYTPEERERSRVK